MTWTKSLQGQPGFTPAQKRTILARGICECPGCHNCLSPLPGKVPCAASPTEADHHTPRHLGGRNTLDNGRAFCEPCHSVKSEAERLAALRRTTDKLKRPSARR